MSMINNILSFIDNMKDFLSSLTTIDIIFFFTVLILMILLVTLLYFIKSNSDYPVENDVDFNKQFEEEKPLQGFTIKPSDIDYTNPYNNAEQNVNQNSYNNSFENSSFNNAYDDEEGELLDLETITKKLENKELSTIDLSSFEEEQERDAIISYDELLKKAASPAIEEVRKPYTASPNISYKKETMFDDLLVKEVDLDSLNKPAKEEIKVVNYQEEEAFLDALKRLQKELR